jgi:hypothetical protein
MPARRHKPRSASPVLADLPAGRGGAAQVLRHRAWTPDDANRSDEPSGDREARPARRSSSSFITAPLRESFFDLAQRYHRLRESAFHKGKPVSERKPVRVDTTPPPIPLTRERKLADLAPPRDEQESVTEALFADRFVEDAPDEATLVQPLARRPSEAPPGPVPERAAYATLRPPPPPEPLPRLMPSTLPPPVALATVPPPPPPSPPQGIWRPMLATAALSATIGAIVSVGMWAVRSPAEASKPVMAATLAPLKAEPTAVNTVGPCPIPSTPSNSTTTSSTSLTSVSSMSQGPVPHEVSLEALPVETRSSRAATNAAPVLRAPVAPPPRAARAVVSERAVATRAAAAEPARPARAESDHASRHPHKAAEVAAASDDDDDAPAAAPPPSPPPAPTAGPDRTAIARAVGRAASAASSCETGPQSGRAQITFAPSGNVQSVQLIQPFSDNAVNGCVLRALGRAHVPPFAGEPVIVRKALSW